MGRKVFSIVFFCLVIFFTSSLAYAAIYVANNSSNTVTVYPIGSSTSTASYTISGLNGPAGVAVDASHIYVANSGSNTVTVYPIGSSTSTASYTISGLNTAHGVAVDASYIYVANYNGNTVTVYPIGSSTSTASYTISGLNNPAFVALDPTPPTTSDPTKTEWGMITFAVLAGLMSVYYLRRQQGLAAK